MTDIAITEKQILLFWGKTCRQEDDPQNFMSRYHPLLFHLLDVAHTALELWKTALPEAFKKRIGMALGCDLEAARMTVAFLAGVHDLGDTGLSISGRHAAWLAASAFDRSRLQRSVAMRKRAALNCHRQRTSRVPARPRLLLAQR